MILSHSRVARRFLAPLLFSIVCTLPAAAHDIWIEASNSLIRTGDWVQLSLMLGNHGNEHRDFRLASKVPAGDQQLKIYGPEGKVTDFTSNLIDNGYTPQEGFWSAKFQPSVPGLYMAVSTFDKVMSYAPVRDIKSAKTLFLVSNTLDKVSAKTKGFDRVLGHPLEIAPQVHPITPFGPGSKMKVKVLYKGKPRAGLKVSFLPRGVNIAKEFDSAYEAVTDKNGIASMELKEANQYLVVTHFKDSAAAGVGYQSIGYSASLTVLVPGICACCK